MTGSRLVAAVARTTGDSPRTVRRLGFGRPAGPPPTPAGPDDLHLAADCPLCGGPCRVPPHAGGPPVTCGCGRCGVGFDARPGDLYVAAGASSRRDSA